MCMSWLPHTVGLTMSWILWLHSQHILNFVSTGITSIAEFSSHGLQCYCVTLHQNTVLQCISKRFWAKYMWHSTLELLMVVTVVIAVVVVVVMVVDIVDQMTCMSCISALYLNTWQLIELSPLASTWTSNVPRPTTTNSQWLSCIHCHCMWYKLLQLWLNNYPNDYFFY